MANRPVYFHTREIDDTPAQLEQSFALRYQVYCLERAFLNPEHYANQLEIDEFDADSLHFGTINLQGELVGTARLVRDGAAGSHSLSACVWTTSASSRTTFRARRTRRRGEIDRASSNRPLLDVPEL